MKTIKILGPVGTGICIGGGRDVYTGEVVEVDDHVALSAIVNGAAVEADLADLQPKSAKKPQT